MGNYLGGSKFGGSHSNETPAKVIAMKDGGYIMAGTILAAAGDVTFSYGDVDWWLVKLSKAVGISDISSGDFQILSYPNPATDMVTISISGAKSDYYMSVFNMQGVQVIQKQVIHAQQDNIQLDFSSFSKGIYIIRLENQEFVKTEKIVLY